MAEAIENPERCSSIRLREEWILVGAVFSTSANTAHFHSYPTAHTLSCHVLRLDISSNQHFMIVMSSGLASP